MTLLSLYLYPFIASAVVAPLLGWLGCHVSARGQAMQTLCVSQGAALGMLLALGLMGGMATTPMEIGMVLASALVSSIAVSDILERITSRTLSSKSACYTGAFALLMAAAYLVAALFPALESHFTQRFFGDLATVSDRESLGVIALTVGIGAYLLRRRQQIDWETFSIAVFGERSALEPLSRQTDVFRIASILLICIAVQVFGVLFTLGFLFLPTVLLRGTFAKTLRGHRTAVVAVATASSVAGFALTLTFTRLPTVPVMIGMLAVLGCALATIRLRR